MRKSRQADLTDLPAIRAIESASFKAGEGFSPRQLRHLLSCPSARWWLIDDAAVCCWLKVNNGRRVWARLYSLAVHPKARRQGLASQLLEEGFAWMIKEGLTRCFAEVAATNTRARALYREHGFVERHRLPSYYGLGHDGVSLMKEVFAAKRVGHQANR